MRKREHLDGRSCVVCHGPLKARDKRTCSHLCLYVYRASQKFVARPCGLCGTEFQVTRALANKKQRQGRDTYYCCDEHAKTAIAAKTITATCDLCGKAFERNAFAHLGAMAKGNKYTICDAGCPGRLTVAGAKKAYRTSKHPKTGERVFTHRLVWEQHHGPIPDGLQIHHKNGNHLDNSPHNLELWTAGSGHLGGARILDVVAELCANDPAMESQLMLAILSRKEKTA